jgi:ABC-type branched-subunit amino acid transport system ATPase component
MALLELKGLTKHFGGVMALDDLYLDVIQGQILGIIGPNGAGKTTLFNLVSGVYKPTKGKVVFKGKDITGLRTDRIARRGIVRTFQSITLWQGLSVMDTMRAACHMVSGVSFFGTFLNTPRTCRKEETVDQKAMEILQFVGMDHLKCQLADTCSHGYQRTLGLAIALASKPSLLLLDEPVTALSPERVAVIMALIRGIREQGTTVVIIEHNMRAIFGVCDRLVVLNYGTKIAEGSPAQIKDNPAVIAAYSGRRGIVP